ncbi:hypothetical protein PHYPSEUDO_000453 [Phytophthora pseudosyringae]|uniref:Uncharacterized protein n=1 Tax=Phytophthora pseudosyringae TaxID=221518 RepID=A0A8T1VYI2_9STRA|nr:hypothetical protein PHYPSEUDO_000453 [Phytophthora pseudosyringae]
MLRSHRTLEKEFKRALEELSRSNAKIAELDQTRQRRELSVADYTRLVAEKNQAVRARQQTIKDRDQVVVDLQAVTQMGSGMRSTRPPSWLRSMTYNTRIRSF